MSKGKNNASVEATIALLARKFPAAIHVFERRRQPLEIGVFEKIITALPELDSKLLKASLRSYCGNEAYLQALLAQGAMRIGLDGAPVAPVSPEDAASTVGRLAKRRAEQAAKAAAKATQARAAAAGGKATSNSTTASTASPPVGAVPSGPPRTSLAGLRQAARARRAGVA
jgi:sRNA-binding protein